MRETPQSELLAALDSLYRTRDYSDLVIFSRDGIRHPAHRAIVCSRSAFLHTAVKERRWRDGTEGHISLAEDEPEIVRMLLEYFYHLDYEPPIPALPPKDTDEVSLQAESSDKSDTQSVRTDAVQYGNVYGASAVTAFGGPTPSDPLYSPGFNGRSRRDSSLTVHALPGHDFSPFGERPTVNRSRNDRSARNTVVEVSPLATPAPNLVVHAKMYAAGERYGVSGLKALALDKFKIQLTRHWNSPEFAEAIHVVYDSTPSSDREMRETVADTIDCYGQALLEKDEVECAIMEINGLAYELLKRSRRASDISPHRRPR